MKIKEYLGKPFGNLIFKSVNVCTRGFIVTILQANPNRKRIFGGKDIYRIDR